MVAKHRCPQCSHQAGVRVVTETSKRDSKGQHDAKMHKKPCSCTCH